MHVTRIRATAASCALMASALTVLTGAGPTSASPAEVPLCDGHEATIVASPVGVVHGTAGDDVIVGTDYADEIFGGAGNDIICGGDGNDRLHGGPGDDRVFGGAQDVWSYFDHLGDTIFYGPGNDYLDPGQQPPDVTEVVPDRIQADPTTADGRYTIYVDHTETHGIIHGPHGEEDLFVRGDALEIRGGPFHDTLHGSPLRDHLASIGQGDTLYGYGGDDELRNDYGQHARIYGGDGDDEISSLSPYASTVLGGSGDDEVTQVVARGDATVTRGKAGFDLIRLKISPGAFRAHLVTRVDHRKNTLQLGTSRLGRLTSYEEIYFDTGRRVVFHGDGADDWMTMLSGGPLKAWTYRGDDFVVGSEKDDYIRAGRGTDNVTGGGGDDVCRNVEINGC